MKPEAGFHVQRRALHGALLALLLVFATTPVLASFVPARLSGSTTLRISISAQPFPCLLSSSHPPSLPTSSDSEYQWNALTKLALPGGTTSLYGHDALQRVTSSTTRDPGGNPLLSRGYQYTPSGYLVAMTTERGSHGFSYDHHRLAAATNPELSDEAYGWDLLDNRVSSAQAPGEWTYDAESQLLSFPGGACDYDALGRTVRKVVGGVEQLFFYDPAGRLERIEDGTGFVVARYAYDPFGRRLWKQIADLPRTYYAYGDEGLVGEYDQEGRELCAYGYEPGSAWTTAPLWLRRDGITYWYHVDRQGRPYKLTDTSGAVVWEAIYDSFGGCTLLANDVPQNLRQPGQYFDVESGLCYNWHRYYDPALGRYLTPDPLGEGANPYGYAAGNPLAYTDPMGLCMVASSVGYYVALGLTAAVGTAAAPVVAGVFLAAQLFTTIDSLGAQAASMYSGKNISSAGAHLIAEVTGWSIEDSESAYGYVAAAIGGGAAGASAAAAGAGAAGAGAGGGGGGAASGGGRSPASAGRELAKPGEDLYVGPYSKSFRANKGSGLASSHVAHHAPQDAVTGVSTGRGITINIRRDLHALTSSFCRRAPKGAEWRELLVRDVRELQSFLRGAGYDMSFVRRQLLELIRQNKSLVRSSAAGG